MRLYCNLLKPGRPQSASKLNSKFTASSFRLSQPVDEFYSSVGLIRPGRLEIIFDVSAHTAAETLRLFSNPTRRIKPSEKQNLVINVKSG